MNSAVATITADDPATASTTVDAVPPPSDREMECPVCGHTMPNLRGGRATICANCGFKDSCCF